MITQKVDIMPKRRNLHEGKSCGPCQLCGDMQCQYYAHPIYWKQELQQGLMEVMLILKDVFVEIVKRILKKELVILISVAATKREKRVYSTRLCK